jgi:hypothetical protein
MRVVATDNSICEQRINFTLKQESKNGEGQRSAYGFRSASAGEHFLAMILMQIFTYLGISVSE